MEKVRCDYRFLREGEMQSRCMANSRFTAIAVGVVTALVGALVLAGVIPAGAFSNPVGGTLLGVGVLLAMVGYSCRNSVRVGPVYDISGAPDADDDAMENAMPSRGYTGWGIPESAIHDALPSVVTTRDEPFDGRRRRGVELPQSSEVISNSLKGVKPIPEGRSTGPLVGKEWPVHINRSKGTSRDNNVHSVQGTEAFDISGRETS